MRPAALFLTVMAVVLALASGLALAEEKSGDGGNNRLVGTPHRDTISGAGGNDDIFGKAKRDRLYGDSGADKVFGNTGPDYLFAGMGPGDRVYGDGGNDFLNTIDERRDRVIDCGAGNEDEAYVDFKDVENVSENCEGLAAVLVVSDANEQCAAALARVEGGAEAIAVACDIVIRRIR
jgi:hypothetical protein